MEAIEFRVSPDGCVYYKQGKQEEKRLTRFCVDIYIDLIGMIKDRFPEAWKRLTSIYKPKNQSAAATDMANFKVAERFIRCNFGEHDLLYSDIESNILHFEEVRCPLRGLCPDENVICKPKGLYRLTKAEKEVASLFIEGYTFSAIAEKLGKSPSTIKQQLWKLKNKLGVKKCREIIRMLRSQNI